jgi:ZIP family zinc transporter
VSAWSALLWGALSSASLLLGQAVAGRMRDEPRLTGQVMGFGAGALLSAVAYELVPSSSLGSHSFRIGIWFLVGALTYYVADRLVDRGGGAMRQDIDASAQPQGSGMAMFLGALLDGIPEAFILGLGLALGGAISVAFVVAIFVSNVPQGVAGTLALEAAGVPSRRILWMWTILTIVCALTAAGGFLLADNVHNNGLYASAFAGGAVLTMLADSMMPEAFEHGGRSVGIVTVAGYLIAGVLAVAA